MYTYIVYSILVSYIYVLDLLVVCSTNDCFGKTWEWNAIQPSLSLLYTFLSEKRVVRPRKLRVTKGEYTIPFFSPLLFHSSIYFIRTLLFSLTNILHFQIYSNIKIFVKHFSLEIQIVKLNIYMMLDSKYFQSLKNWFHTRRTWATKNVYWKRLKLCFQRGQIEKFFFFYFLFRRFFWGITHKEKGSTRDGMRRITKRKTTQKCLWPKYYVSANIRKWNTNICLSFSLSFKRPHLHLPGLSFCLSTCWRFQSLFASRFTCMYAYMH